MNQLTSDRITKAFDLIQGLTRAMKAVGVPLPLAKIESIVRRALSGEFDDSQDLYYIQNRGPVGNCLQWWAHVGQGYTCDLDKAWRVSRAEALNIIKRRPDIDKAWCVSDINKLAYRHFDMQRLRNLTPLTPGTLAE